VLGAEQLNLAIIEGLWRPEVVHQGLTSISFANYDKIRIVEIEHVEADNIPGKPRLNGKLDNNGHTAVLNVLAEPGNGVLSGGPLAEDYQILQLHFHWGADDTKGSEHTVAGRSFPMELHVVHKKISATMDEFLTLSDGLAVTGFMFEISESDNEHLTVLLESLEQIETFGASLPMNSSSLKVSDLVPTIDGASYMTYPGSLTTPPCNEAVTWLNFNQTIPISRDQLAKFRDLEDNKGNPLVDNFRPPQPLNDREVKLFST
jgi:carbonic anhydrase